ncbi:cytochrome c3 family protein [Shewanella sp. GXUN23E]|uniref:cytochrome c3 family protein n=1 Tax=Shewanella sp. GXUN23E TaxID=3422498 RepID=UPI003D7C5302
MTIKPLSLLIAGCLLGSPAMAADVKDELFINKFEQANYSQIGAAQCRECHKDAMQGFLSSIHGNKTLAGSPAAGIECEACHGPLGQHADEPQANPMLRPGPMTQANASAKLQNQLCLRCHGDQFPLETTPCAACHTGLHTDNAIPDTQKQTLACLECHPQLQKQVRMKFTHGLVDDHGNNIQQGCSTYCHAAHGSKWEPAYQTPALNAPCFECHIDKQGPFKTEHTGFKGNCSHCHDPHGTEDEHLLRPNIGEICAQCHGEQAVLEQATSAQVHGHN